MSSLLFTGLAFACAGGVCALAGDLQRRMYLGLACFLAVNAVIWVRFVHALFTAEDLLVATALFLLSHLAATCAYLATIYFLDTSGEPTGMAAVARD
jgi:predicted neutral ceramidase superfamily lipid hydrolase